MLKACERQLREEAERRHLEHLLQETHAALDAATAAAAAAAAAEQEAAARTAQERTARESVEDAIYAAESHAESLETGSAELREEVKRLGARIEEACETERALQSLLERTEQGRAEAECAGEAARRDLVAARSELLESRRHLDERESDSRELAGQVSHGEGVRVNCFLLQEIPSRGT